MGFTSCDSSSASSENFGIGSGQGVVDSDFEETVARFLEEAEKRNSTLDISDLDIIYSTAIPMVLLEYAPEQLTPE